MKTKQNMIRKFLPLILTIFWMALIFYFSAQPREMSANVSETIGERILETVYPGFSEMNPASRQAMIEGVDALVRKSAHFVEYLILGVLLTLDLQPLQKKKRFLPLLLAILIGFFYACFDEIHQMFVPGRAGMVRDVLLDTAGVICGALFSRFFFKMQDHFLL